MKIYHIYICSYGIPCSGGDTFVRKIIPLLAPKSRSTVILGYNNIFLSPDEMKQVNVVSLLPKNVPDLSYLMTVLFYFYLFLKSIKYLKIIDQSPGTIISHSDSWPDMLFAFLAKLKKPDLKWIAINHLLQPNPFKGYKHSYSKNFKFPSPVDIYHWLNQRFFFLLQRKADLLISINSGDLPYLKQKNKNVFIIKHGKEYSGYAQESENGKIFDICFLGRFFIQKGIEEIPEIIQSTGKIYNRKLRLLFIGEQNQTSKRLERTLLQQGHDVYFSGYVEGEKKYKLLQQSKVLLYPSYYESFGIVYLDAISVGLPVVEYDLPCFNDHKFGALKIPFKDNDAFAEGIVKLLSDDKLYNQLSDEGYKYSQKFTWEKSAESLQKHISAWSN